jgi:hypothetical protein
VSAATSQIALKNVLALAESLPRDAFKTLEEKAGQATVLDFKTDKWHLLGTLSGSYKMIYGARSRFLRATDEKALWQDHCVFDDAESQATLEKLTANGGALPRSKIDEASKYCAETLLEHFLDPQG